MSNTNSNANPNTNNDIHNTTTRSTITTITTNTTTRVGPGGTTGSQACAACKYQRRRCAPDCPLAPHFPQHQHKQFLNVHKLFGVSNIVKVLKAAREDFEKEIAMKSMIFHANVRANDPVGGCHRIIRELERQIQHCEAELELVLHQLALCRAEAQDAVNNMQNPIVSDYYYGRSARNQPVQDHQLGFDLQRSGAIKADVQASSSSSSMSMVVNGKQLFAEEDIKPHFRMFDEKQSVLFESE